MFNFKSEKSLKTTLNIFFIIKLVLVVITFILVLFLYINQNNLAKSRDAHFNSYLLADELRQSSDDLTHFARAYVETGDSKFESYYWQIIDIRNGKIPRPTNYNHIYWDYVAGGNKEPLLYGETISLHDLMKREGFTNSEFEKLSLAQKNSDDLVKTENIAMNAAKGLFDDGSGNYVVKKEPDRILANRLMNDESYYKMKAEIMKPVDEFFKMFEERTNGIISKYIQIENILFITVIILSFIILLFLLFSFIITKRQIVEKEKFEDKLKEEPIILEQKVLERTEELKKSEEKMKKILIESERFNKLMVGRELEMIKLKKEINDLKNNNIKI